MSKHVLLFLIILVEGYAVLACELLVIRQLVPFVGSSTETIAIIISGVLMPLAVGYHFGGTAFHRIYKRASKRNSVTIRHILASNILKSVAVLGVGLSYPLLELFFALLGGMGITYRLAQTAIYVMLFLVTPIFLLGQTVPLVSHYFSKRKLSEITGKILFFSTTGSFLGSIFSTIVLMSTIGVQNTVIVTLGMLCLLCLLLAGRTIYYGILSLSLFGFIFLLNYLGTMQSFHIVENNAYNTVRVVDGPDGRNLIINRSNSSFFANDRNKRFEYIKYVEKTFIAPLTSNLTPPRDILVIGAGGFTVGWEDHYNHYTFVDIDKDLKDTAERYFLPETLPPNKQFIPASARAFVHASKDRYDLIFLDTYTNVMSIPMETTTKEYLQEVKRLLKDGGVVVANIISSAQFDDLFTVRYDNTFSAVFPNHSRHVVTPYNPWDLSGNHHANVMYSYIKTPFGEDRQIYTDDRNTYSFDRH